MTTLRVVGWNPGLQTVSLVLLVKEATGSLVEAKRLVDALLDGEEFEIPFEDDVNARDFRERAERLGAIFGDPR